MDDLLNQLWVAWQPIVDLSSGVPMGHEALIRGPVNTPWAMPADLFAWASREGRAWDLELICRSMALMQPAAEWTSGHHLFLNLDSRWPQLPEPWEHRASETVPLVLELSERQALLENPKLLSALVRWRRAGHLLALDDYGTGYAAAGTVLAIQPHLIKLDRTLIADMDQSIEKQSLFRALRAWTRDLGIRLVAEGIETEAELAVLQDYGCDYGQGFLLGRPEPVLQSRPRVTMPMHTSAEVPEPSHAERALSFYATAITNSPIPSYVVDTRRRMVAWNAAAEQLLGFTAHTLVGHACYLSPLDHQDSAGHRLCVAACPLVEAMAQGTVRRDRVTVRTRTGPRRTIDVSVIPIMDTSTGRVVGALEQFQVVAGRRETADLEREAHIAARPDPMSFTRGARSGPRAGHQRTSQAP